MLQVVSIKIFLMNFDFLFSRCHFRNPGHQYVITIIKNITKYLTKTVHLDDSELVTQNKH